MYEFTQTRSFAHPGEYFPGRVSAVGTPPRGIEKFVAARWLRVTGHPVVVSRWDSDSDLDSDSKQEKHLEIYRRVLFY